MSTQAPPIQVFKLGLLRCALNCSITALILSLVSIALASYALSFNVIPVPVRYARYFSASGQANPLPTGHFNPRQVNVKAYNSDGVREMQTSFLSNFFRRIRSYDDTTIIFQSIPLCGGDIFPGLVEKLVRSDGKPRFLHVAEFTDQYPSLPNTSDSKSSSQLEIFTKQFILKSPKPLFLFVERGGSVPIIEDRKVHYISLICDPASRLIENYRVDHMGEDAQLQYALPKGLRMRTKPISFESCFKQNLPECYGNQVQSFLLQHFCSDSAKCKSLNLNVPLQSSLDVAKKYTAIGHLEEFEPFLKLLEKTLPNYFSGIVDVFAHDDDFEAFRSKKSPLEGENRPHVTEDLFKELQQHIWPDYGFYWKIRKMFNVLPNT